MTDYHRKDEMQSFIDLDKTSVLQETKIFNESPVCVKKCCAILAKANRATFNIGIHKLSPSYQI